MNAVRQVTLTEEERATVQTLLHLGIAAAQFLGGESDFSADDRLLAFAMQNSDRKAVSLVIARFAEDPVWMQERVKSF